MFNSEAKQNYAKKSDFSWNERKFERLKLLNNIWVLIGCMFDTFKKITPFVKENLFQKIQLRPVPVTVSNGRKFDLLIMSSKTRHLTAQDLRFFLFQRFTQ